MTTPNEAPPPGGHRIRFIVNVLWNWAAAIINIFASLILAPIIIRRLGDENYGLWAITASLAEYYWIIDLGFRSATVKFAAHYRTLNDPVRINEIVNTALFYSSCVGPVLLLTNYLLAPHLASWMHISHPLFPKLIMIVLSAWILGSLFNVFFGCLEGFQRFDLLNKINIVGAAIRAFATAALLLMGYGVLEMALVHLVSQAIVHLLSFLAFRRTFPESAFAPRFVKLSVLRTMFSYGSHSVVASIASRSLNQGAPLVIAYLLPTQYVGYYTAPSRLLDGVVDGILRIGMVSNPIAAELTARRQHSRLRQLSVIANRYSLALFLPLTIFLSVYSYPLLAVWLKRADFAAQSYGVLSALLAGITIAQAGQYNSISILFGVGRHKLYSWSLLVEAALAMTGIALVVPHYGVTGAAWVVSALMILNRGAFLAWLLTRELQAPYFWFIGNVYRPLLIAIGPMALLWYLRSSGLLPGSNWFQLILAGAIGTLCYLPLTFFIIERDHRMAIFDQLRRLRARLGGREVQSA